MGLFEKIFSKKEQNLKVNQYFKLLNAYQPAFTSFEGGLYEMELVRSAINAIATHCSKLMPEVVGAANPQLKQVLKTKPNLNMSTSQFLYRVATILAVNNTAFIVPMEDNMGKLTGFYPVLPNRCEVMEYNHQPYLRYEFSNGNKASIELSRCGVLTNFQYKSDIFGSNNKALFPTMQLIHAQNEGIREGIKNTATFRFMAKLNNFINEEDLQKERTRFVDENFKAEHGPMLLFPNEYTDIKQIDSQPFVVNAAQMKIIQENVYNYFGVNEDILQNRAIGDKWAAFYEGKIEPFSIQLSLAMTNMVFTDKERSYGNEIVWTSNRTQYMSSAEKLNMVQLFDRGIMSLNDLRQVWNLPPVEGGDERYIRKEYANINDIDKENEDDQ